MQGKRPATIDGYSRALPRITHHLDKSPDTLTTEDLKRYFAQRIKTYSWSTVRIDQNGLRKLWVSYLLPDTLTTDDLKRYFAQLIKTHSWNTVRIDRNGLQKLWVSYVIENKR